MLNFIKQRCYNYALLMRLNRPLPMLLLLWPTLWALWIASSGHPSFKLLFIFISGVIVMRSAGCVINDFADRDFDKHVERTRNRPMAIGSVSRMEALILFASLCLVALLLVLQLNTLTISLAIPAVLLTICYPFAKRFTHLPQILLGIIFGGWGVLMAFAAQNHALPSSAWLLFFSACLWPVIYDTFYAMVDRTDDQRIGVKSTAILFNRYDRLITGLLQFAMWLLLMALGYILSLNLGYFLSIFVMGGFFIYQQYLIKYRDRDQCFKAFLNNNWVGLVIFLGLVLAYWH
jgi:4-hydroxybenzoate polyprenyltransferase